MNFIDLDTNMKELLRIHEFTSLLNLTFVMDVVICSGIPNGNFSGHAFFQRCTKQWCATRNLLTGVQKSHETIVFYCKRTSVVSADKKMTCTNEAGTNGFLCVWFHLEPSLKWRFYPALPFFLIFR